MIAIIDPHIHFFDLQMGQYEWLVGDTPPNWANLSLIKQNHNPNHLKNPTFLVEAVVHIEAGFNNQHPHKELEWLAKAARPLRYGAIAYIDITLEPIHFSEQLSKLLHDPCLRGIRDITEGTDAIRLLHPNVFTNLSTLSCHKLCFEAQFELNNQQVANQVANYCLSLPHLSLFLNHAGLLERNTQWDHSMAKLSSCPNIAIKFSGFEHLISPLSKNTCLQLCLQYFGDERIMFASNYPVCLMEKSYEEIWLEYRQLVENEVLWKKLSYHNAKRLYRL
ncbi:amidohydrolase family protein [Pseudoalteromonas aurantia]|uniref:Amidohydrolase-related domain-containing protein n=1 Tax=Pseudoalteromonas aurantia 208 TaxID=1314867 RepID=A0ABR9E5J0_9GAMM|nr:amidohydrolase family protein [Pseudoalteromonas aurantia]MBE0366265.1 hypothetical protein [Pseudoalteromonas aurantia 208]